MSRDMRPRLVIIRCFSCKKDFYPYGRMQTIPPVSDQRNCTHCGVENYLVFDEQLGREMARKDLGLDKKIDEKVKRLELENKALKIEIESLKNQVKENTETIKTLEIGVGKKIVETRKQLSKEIAQILGERTKKKPVFQPI